MRQEQARRRILASVAAVLAATALLASSPSGASNPGANGHGNLISSGGLRTFSFSVTTRADGTVKGHANVNNRGMDIKAFVDIDCATFLPGGRAILSGPITKSSNPALIVPGRIAVFGIEDNGEGSNAPVDRITTIPDYPPPKSCTEFTFVGDTLQEIANPNVVVRPLTPILAGNIQVRT
jgi:hypothetical protein